MKIGVRRPKVLLLNEIRAAWVSILYPKEELDCISFPNKTKFKIYRLNLNFINLKQKNKKIIAHK